MAALHAPLFNQRLVIRRTPIDPGGDLGDDVRAQWLRLRRHPRILFVTDKLHQSRSFCVARNNVGTFVTRMQQPLAGREVKPSLDLFTPMALEAMLRQDRSD